MKFNLLAAAMFSAVAAFATTSVAAVDTTLITPGPAVSTEGWDTPESIRGGLKLLYAWDSSGPDAWDSKAHPMVYVTSEGIAKARSPGNNKNAGLYIIDAYTKEVVASARYDLGLGEHTAAGHTAGISVDGKWFYIGSTVIIDGKATPLTLVINARTLKVDKAFGFPLHHSIGFVDYTGKPIQTVTKNSGPHFLLDPQDDNRVIKALTATDIVMIGHNYVTADPTGKYLYVSQRPGAWGAADSGADGGMSKYNLETGKVTYIWGMGHNGNPIGNAHTADGKYTYVNEGHGSYVYKIDNETNTIVASSSAGVAGPYGNVLNWDESLLFIIGKGEGSHNTGRVIGVIETKTFKQSKAFQQPIVLDGSASSIDHAILHPDPAVNEIWVSNMAGWETIVLDPVTFETKALIPTPNFGDTHSGGFVKYGDNWAGELLVDMGGPQAAMYAQKLAIIAAAAK
jgi:DNA-binding beta-propeller fold protein YncE